MFSNRIARWLLFMPALFALRPASAADAVPPAAASTQISIRWVPVSGESNGVAAEVLGLDRQTLAALHRLPPKDSEWQRFFPVQVEQGDPLAGIGLPRVAGAYLIESGVIRFVPRFAFVPGLRYRAVFDPGQLPNRPAKTAPVAATFELPVARPTPTTAVSRVYPSANVLPENLLKFYVHFSAPMRRGGIYDHIHLRDDAGNPVELPFLEIDEELWNPEMTRLTLFIDPGRIKRGVKPLEEIGPALENGRRFTLVIDRAWKDAAGNPLQSSFEKSFKVVAPDREPPEPGRWKIATPSSSTVDALAVELGEPMDHALASRMIRVTTDSGAVVEGTIELAEQEQRWRFTPSRPWAAGSYRLVIQTTLEDLAGNNIGRPFEVDLVNGVQRRLTNSTVRLSFAIR